MGGLLVCSPIPPPEQAVFNPRSPSWRSDRAILSSLANAFFPLYNISALKNASSVKSATRPSTASTILKTKPETKIGYVGRCTSSKTKIHRPPFINTQILLNGSNMGISIGINGWKIRYFYNHSLFNGTKHAFLALGIFTNTLCASTAN